MVKLSKASGITCIARLETKASDKSQTCVRAARWQPTRLLSRCRRWLATATTSTARVALELCSESSDDFSSSELKCYAGTGPLMPRQTPMSAPRQRLLPALSRPAGAPAARCRLGKWLPSKRAVCGPARSTVLSSRLLLGGCGR